VVHLSSWTWVLSFCSLYFSRALFFGGVLWFIYGWQSFITFGPGFEIFDIVNIYLGILGVGIWTLNLIFLISKSFGFSSNTFFSNVKTFVAPGSKIKGPVSKTPRYNHSSPNMHVLIIEHFPIFSPFVNQIEWFFLCHWMCKLEIYKCSLRLEAKNKHRKHKKRMCDSLL